ncbi:hypothetical protein EDM68_01670 [Candidatus Uhrbacteria bacterium]|nr:MAG: hypothetical protein EDM68_01670 [Candidatus Uhrbacteria bacterium]
MSSSFAYVYDERLGEHKFHRDVARFEADLAGFGIGGRVARLSLFKQAKASVEDFVRDGVRHVVIVGDEGTLLRMMWFLPELPVVIGFVPLLGTSSISRLLGMTDVASAIRTLAGRLTTTLDVGKVGDRCFLTSVVIPDTRAELEVDGRFRLRPTEGGTIIVSNFGNGDPRDGLLDVRVSSSVAPKTLFRRTPKESFETVLRLTRGAVRSETPVRLLVDGQALEGTSFKIGVLPGKLRFLIGKGHR